MEASGTDRSSHPKNCSTPTFMPASPASGPRQGAIGTAALQFPFPHTVHANAHRVVPAKRRGGGNPASRADVCIQMPALASLGGHDAGCWSLPSRLIFLPFCSMKGAKEITMLDPTTPKGRILAAALACAATKSWADVTLLDIGEAA